MNKIEFNSILDVGCGEGFLLSNLESFVRNKRCYAIDLDENEVKDAKNNLPFCEVKIGSAYNIPYEDNLFELVTCTEVFEHLEKPLEALEEINRVSSKYILLSVPNEPTWRILNVARLTHLKDLGNTPGHLNHWRSREFEKFVKQYFNIVMRLTPLPWTIILAQKK